MEIPDMLVVTKADLGQVAINARRDLSAALRSLGKRTTRVLAVTSLPPSTGIEELLDGLQAHWSELGEDDARALAERRLRARRAGALTAFAVEHGERGLRALGGRRTAERWLTEQDAKLDEVALMGLLEGRMSDG
jgi:LAO/AO transport system kinase